MNQLKKGISIEREHKNTINYIRDFCSKGKCPTNNQIFEHIAKDHLKEDKNYYNKLKKERL
jgi:sulfur relay (sulfurtransferase) DsrC/TusE family protein